MESNPPAFNRASSVKRGKNLICFSMFRTSKYQRKVKVKEIDLVFIYLFIIPNLYSTLSMFTICSKVLSTSSLLTVETMI